MKKTLLAVVLFGLAILPAISYGQDDQFTKDEVSELKKMLGDKQKTDIKVAKDFDLDFYGFVRLDSTWSNSDLTSAGGGTISLWAKPENSDKKNDSEFAMSARGTRLGLNIAGPGNDWLKTSGKIEFDFGLTGAENSNEPRMRHAYLVFDFPDNNFSILAGQTWDVISPLAPPTQNLSIMWYSGNIGMRRPQLRLTKVVPVNETSSFKFETAATRTIGQNNLDGKDSGDDSGWPTAQARISYTTPLISNLPATFGVSGHYGTEEFAIAAGQKSSIDVESWSFNVDMTMPITKEVNVTGEFYTGTNCRTYYGGIGHGVVVTNAPYDVEEVDAMGGWMGLSYKPAEKWQFAGGYAIDTVDTDNLPDDGSARKFNATAFANVCYSPFKATLIGMETAYHRTQWHKNDDGHATRVSMFMQLNF